MSEEQRAPRPVLARSANRVHVTTCRHAQNAATAVRWEWADSHNSAEVARIITHHELQPCLVCQPVGTLARWESRQRATSRSTGTLPTGVEVLEFERAHPGMTGRKMELIRAELGITAARYVQLLSAAARSEEGVQHDAVLAHQVDDRLRSAAASREARLRREQP